MSTFAVLSVVILAVAGQDPLHDPAYRFSLPLQQQMKMIRHQAVGVKKKAELCLLDRQQREEFLEVRVRVKDRLPVVSAGDEMIKPARNPGSRSSCHNVARILLPRDRMTSIINRRIDDLTPQSRHLQV